MSGKCFSFDLLPPSEFCTALVLVLAAVHFIIIPHKTEVSRREIQIITPRDLSDSILAPIPVIRKAGPVLLKKASARDAFSLSVCPDVTRFAAAAAPAGYPERFPIRKSTAQFLSIPNSFSKGTDISFPITLPAPEDVIRAETTRKGNNDGITVPTQSRSDSVAADDAVSENITRIGNAEIIRIHLKMYANEFSFTLLDLLFERDRFLEMSADAFTPEILLLIWLTPHKINLQYCLIRYIYFSCKTCS